MDSDKKRKRGRPPIPGLIRKSKVNITLDPHFIEQMKAEAERRKLSLSQFVTLALEQEVARVMAEDPSNVVAMPTKPHLMAAAGSPIGAEVEDWDGADNTVRVRINGLSMVPLFNDQDVVSMHHKRGARSVFMKKGLVYLVEYDGGYTVKEYNTRKATADEQGEEWVVDGKVKVLRSHNPDFPEIIIKGPVEWIAWFDPKVDRV